MVRFIKICFLQLSLLVFVQVASAQILGSSTGIFKDNSKPTATSKKKKTTVKKAKNLTESIKSKPTNLAKTPTKNTAKPQPNKKIQKTQTAVVRPNVAKKPFNTVSIIIGKPTSGDFNELFEQSIEEGNVARDERNYQLAEKSYRKSQVLKPKDGRWIYGLGNIFSDQQRWEEAEKAYRAAVNLEPNSPEAHIALSFVLAQPIAGADLAKRFDEAESMARKALTLDANNPIAHDQLGVSLEMQGAIGLETKTAYLKAIEFDPAYALAFAHLGRLYRRNGSTTESSAAYRKAIELANDIPTMILVAEVFQTQQKFTESEQLLRRALNADSKNPTALYLLGRALSIRGNFDEAENVLKKSLTVSPNSFVPYSILASVYSRRARFDETEKILVKSVKVASISEKKQLALDFVKLSEDLLKLRRTDDAIRVLKLAVDVDKNNTEIVSELARVQKLKIPTD
jgi:tetratricopeptide (TPR) repeat protein